jgi:hypothetical protein
MYVLGLSVKLHAITCHESGKGRGIALLFLGFDARYGWLVNATSRPLNPQE